MGILELTDKSSNNIKPQAWINNSPYKTCSIIAFISRYIATLVPRVYLYINRIKQRSEIEFIAVIMSVIEYYYGFAELEISRGTLQSFFGRHKVLIPKKRSALILRLRGNVFPNESVCRITHQPLYTHSLKAIL